MPDGNAKAFYPAYSLSALRNAQWRCAVSVGRIRRKPPSGRRFVAGRVLPDRSQQAV
ncbi:hypothetical protein HMPREF0208_00419 [Citrobacter koseri]|nr:hypothetical protein HMPREF3220_01232 [Citrobacter koseri]KXA06199.1 hypothetical protein HMPREF3207_00347 [Citrobacter koseri]KXB46952.1 hypothetical protein HMPREF0208_00419 [Citrobacter koseri]